MTTPVKPIHSTPVKDMTEEQKLWSFAKAVVVIYLETGLPVLAEQIAERMSVSASASTVRRIASRWGGAVRGTSSTTVDRAVMSRDYPGFVLSHRARTAWLPTMTTLRAIINDMREQRRVAREQALLERQRGAGTTRKGEGSIKKFDQLES